MLTIDHWHFTLTSIPKSKLSNHIICHYKQIAFPSRGYASIFRSIEQSPFVAYCHGFGRTKRIMLLPKTFALCFWIIGLFRRCEEDQLDLYYNARFISENNNVIFGLKAMNNSLAGNSSLNLNFAGILLNFNKKRLHLKKNYQPVFSKLFIVKYISLTFSSFSLAGNHYVCRSLWIS